MSHSDVESYSALRERLRRAPKSWLITGVAGFIGSNILEALLKLDQTVIGIDNLSTGHGGNLDEVRELVAAPQWDRFRFVEADIRDASACREAMTAKDGGAVDYVLHQAAIGSVPQSLADPVFTNANNIDGFLNVLVAARDAGVKRFVYAASSATYGDDPGLPKVEDRIGRPLSPYAVTKYVNELYADVFAGAFGTPCVGLRYFNIFGRRQDPEGAYAAVIPKWISALLRGEEVFVNGDGSTSRDFCYVDNAVQANLLAAVRDGPEEKSRVYNVAVGDRTSLSELFGMLKASLVARGLVERAATPTYRDFRPGDVLHSQADITRIRTDLGYAPTHRVGEGLEEAMDWYATLLRPSIPSGPERS